MTRYRGYGRLDDPMQEVGDTGFAALASRDEPTQLQAGVVTEAKIFVLMMVKQRLALDIPLKSILRVCHSLLKEMKLL